MRDTPSAGRKSTPLGEVDVATRQTVFGGRRASERHGSDVSPRRRPPVAGVCGYVVGTLVTYPGRAFSLTAVMIGITLAAIRDHRGTSA